MKRILQRIRWIAICVTLAGFAALSTGCAKKAQQAGGFSMPPMPVEVAKAQEQGIADRLDALGTIEADEAITVVSEIDGVVTSLPFREGDAVGKGTLIARIDDAQLKAETDRAEALRDQSRTAYQRVKVVVEEGAGATQDLDDAAAALKVAEANLSWAQARLAKTRITAPFPGMLGARRVSPGAFLRAGEPITDLARVEELRVNFSAPERFLAKLTRGAEVQVTTTAYPGLAVTGKIDVIEPVLDPQTRSARIVARVANPEGKLRPGMSANVAAVLEQRPSALTIPSEAVFVEGAQAYVYVVKPDSTVTRTAVTLGTRTRDVVEVLAGLSVDASVVRAGHQKLFEGARIMPVVNQPASAGGPGGTATGSEEGAR
jgi:membrane fusion protein (multidrug efflux system)